MGAARAEAEDWPVWRRALYAAAFPLFPLMQWRHVAPEARRSGSSTGQILRLVPSMTLTLGAAAIGEAVGFLAGAGDAQDRWQSFELYRARHLSNRDADPHLST